MFIINNIIIGHKKTKIIKNGQYLGNTSEANQARHIHVVLCFFFRKEQFQHFIFKFTHKMTWRTKANDSEANTIY